MVRVTVDGIFSNPRGWMGKAPAKPRLRSADPDGPMYFVLDGHTLGFITPAQPGVFQVLHGNPLLGGRDWKNGPFHLVRGDNLKPATLDDFKLFRVDPKGHIE